MDRSSSNAGVLERDVVRLFWRLGTGSFTNMLILPFLDFFET